MTAIEWTHRPGTKGESWTPLRARDRATGGVGWHCNHASDGCRNCYAERLNLNRRGLAFGTGLPYKPGHEKDVEIFLDEATLAQPLRWRSPRTIFVCSMSDLFGALVPDAMIDRIFAVAALCPQHTFIVLTKRSKRMRTYMAELEVLAARRREFLAIYRSIGGSSELWLPQWPLPNVWLGVSAERQIEADDRIPDLLNTPAAIRFASLEPLLGKIMLHNLDGPRGTVLDALTGKILDEGGLVTRWPRLDWVIAGGESGPDARPSNPQWFRDLRDQCAAARVPFFFKQWGAWVSVSEVAGAGPHFKFDDGRTVRRLTKRAAGRTLDGVEHNGWPS